MAETMWGGFDAVWTFVHGTFWKLWTALSNSSSSKSLVPVGVVVACAVGALIAVYIGMYRRSRSHSSHRRVFSNTNSCSVVTSRNDIAGRPSTSSSRSRLGSRSAVAVHKFSSPSTRCDPDSSLDEKGGEIQRRVNGQLGVRLVMVWWWWWWWRVVCPVVLLLTLSSVPWEFCRLYQQAVAKKAAVASAGPPLGCSGEPLTLLQTLTLWLSRQLAWGHQDACDLYHQAVFVDPLWEVTPLMVLTSVLSRCVVHPLETLSSGLGGAVRRFLSHVPLHWQPVMIVLATSFFFLLLLLSCRYRLSVPWLFRIEPRTPVLSEKTSKRTSVSCSCERARESVSACRGFQESVSVRRGSTDSNFFLSSPLRSLDTDCSQRLRDSDGRLLSRESLTPCSYSYGKRQRKHSLDLEKAAGSVDIAGGGYFSAVNDRGYPGNSSDDCEEVDKENLCGDKPRGRNTHAKTPARENKGSTAKSLRRTPLTSQESHRSMSLDSQTTKTARKRGLGQRIGSSDRNEESSCSSKSLSGRAPPLHEVDPSWSNNIFNSLAPSVSVSRVSRRGK